MKKYLCIVLLVGACFGQDTYPYFSDMAKQLEFEKKKIVIEEGERTQQIIAGGGSEFNPWSLLTMSPDLKLTYLRDAIPAYKNVPIKTDYKYHSYFNIQIDGIEISEIEMLKTMGLNEEAVKIISNFNKKLKNYEDEKLLYENSMVKYDDNLKLYYKNLREKPTPELDQLELFGLAGSSFLIGILVKNNALMGIGIISSFYIILNSKKDKNPISKPKYIPLSKPKKPSPFLLNEPILKQQLSTAQTKSMVESYNRKLYSDISNK